MGEFESDPWPVRLSVAIYRRLLSAYPSGFRQAYGAHMIQVFRDDYLMVAGQRSPAGLLSLWSRILPDLLRTSIEEHIYGEGERYGMSELVPIEPKVISRREFLSAAWMASLGFLLVDLGGPTYFFAMPIFREGQFGGQFTLGRARDVFPAQGRDPVNVPKGGFWLARTDDNRVLAPYKVCPHLGCLYNWNSAAGIFLCPCHLSQYALDGTFIKGPAPRSVDRFVIRLLDDRGQEVAATDDDGNPLPLAGEDLQVVIDTGKLIRGKPKGERYPVT